MTNISYINSYNPKDYKTKFEMLCTWRASLHGSSVEVLSAISEKFLGRPYLNGALGEGPTGRFDQSPLYRDDAFDCFTYVNTVLALLFAKNISQFEQKIIDLNYYEGMALYQNRFHFMSTDWNPQNAKNSILCDITAKIMQEHDASDPEMASALIDKPNWFLHRTYADIKKLKEVDDISAEMLLKELHNFSKKMNAEIGTVPYIPLKKLFNENEQADIFLFAKIPHGSVVEIVRPNWDLRDKIGTNLNVSHLGFVIHKKNDLLFRHASLTKKSVTEEPLINYLRDNCLNSPTIEGINVQLVVAPAN